MNFRFLKLGLGLIFIVSLASLGAIVVFVNPYQTGVLMRALFSATAFLTLFSLLSITGLRLRKRFVSEFNANRILKMVFRQSVLMSAILILYAWLSHFKLFKIWTAIPILAVAVGAEYYFLTRRQYTNTRE